MDMIVGQTDLPYDVAVGQFCKIFYGDKDGLNLKQFVFIDSVLNAYRDPQKRQEFYKMVNTPKKQINPTGLRSISISRRGKS